MSNLRHDADEVCAVASIETRQHGPADLNLTGAYLCCQALSCGRKLDAHQAAIFGYASAGYQAAALKAVKGRGDGRDGRSERLGDAADAPFFRLSKDYQQADIIGMEIGVGTAGDDAWLQLESLQQQRDPLVQSNRFGVAYLVVGNCRFPHP